MSLVLRISLIFGMVVIAGCQSMARDPILKLTLRVTDDEGTPVEGATASFGGERRPRGPGESSKGVSLEGKTDALGVFTGELEVWNARQSGYSVMKLGYYPVSQHSYSAKSVIRGKWQPWNPTIDVLLKRIKNPVPMYAKRVERGLPALGEKIGYDLLVGDWVAPHGKGEIADFNFLGTIIKLDNDNGDFEVTLTFSNLGDGIQRFTPEPAPCVFPSSYEAPAQGYLSEWKLRQMRRSGVRDVTSFDPKGAYYFRVRTELDKEGNVVKALYGKIYGDFFFMSYYLNPDGTRNMECDPKRNLLKPAVVTNFNRRVYDVGP